jgi:hypothetical protein
MEKFGSGTKKFGSEINIPDPQHWLLLSSWTDWTLNKMELLFELHKKKRLLDAKDFIDLEAQRLGCCIWLDSFWELCLEDEPSEWVAGVEDHAEEEGEQGDGQHVVQTRRSDHQGANTLAQITSIVQLHPVWFFSDRDPTLMMVSKPDPVPHPTRFFSNILDINFTFAFLRCKCIRLLIMTRYKLFWGIFS